MVRAIALKRLRGEAQQLDEICLTLEVAAIRKISDILLL
jgi:hypothetical protein